MASLTRRARSASAVLQDNKRCSSPYIGLSPLDSSLLGTVDMTLKICVIGAPQTGKTNLISMFIRDQFDLYHDPTIHEMHEHQGRLNVRNSMNVNTDKKSSEIIFRTEIVD